MGYGTAEVGKFDSRVRSSGEAAELAEGVLGVDAVGYSVVRITGVPAELPVLAPKVGLDPCEKGGAHCGTQIALRETLDGFV